MTEKLPAASTQRCDTCTREVECWTWADEEGLVHAICQRCLHEFVENDRKRLRGDIV